MRREPPFKKILIANRGEIAVRIIRACHELGVRTVAVHSTADADALHVKIANESVCIGPALSTQSYLNITALISAAVSTGAEAIHPGYGFLSENASFADICGQCGITFIGPKPQDMILMGDKVHARDTAEKNGVPVVPGAAGAGDDYKIALAQAEKIGFPVLIKAAAGGGGRGMKIVHKASDFERLFTQARAEVGAAFNDPTVYVEKYIGQAPHVEVQVLCDSHGNSIHLGERDCSTQRRYQKLIEESPAPGLRPEVRKAMHESALKLVRGMNYVSCGTIEYLVDAATQDFYFIEMNTRLQVEHPVTEMVTSIDIVKEQIWIAAGRELSFTQDDVKIVGHAIEARINAEDPDTFLPSPGEIVGYHAPGGVGVRVDSAIYDRYRIPPHYDSLIAKIIVRGADREEALIKLVTALEECIIGGIRSNLDLHRRILMHPQFASGAVHTQLLDIILAEEKELAESSAAEEDDEEAKTAVA